LQNELKRTEKATNFEGQMRRTNPKSELSCKARIQAEGLCREMGTARRRSGFRNPPQCEKTQKSWERSQEVVENKGRRTLQSAKTNPVLRAKCSHLTPTVNFRTPRASSRRDRCDGMRQGRKSAPQSGTLTSWRKYKNRGNEAKKSLKTKDDTHYKVRKRSNCEC